MSVHRDPAAGADLLTLAADLANVEAVRAVKRLQHAWGHYAEAGDFAALADLFARDGRLVLPPREAEGHTAILELLQETMAGGQAELAADQLNVRLTLSPVVTVAEDGRSAMGRWHEVAMTGRHGVAAIWSGGIHENRYVLEDGTWKIGVLHYHPQFAGDYADGWRNLSDDVPLVPFHFDPDGAGTPVPLVPRAVGHASPDPADLNARAAALVDESEIQNLQAAYGFYVDRKLWDDVADLFAEDGVLETGGEGAYVGRTSIRSGLERFGPAGLRHGELHDHLQLMPVVTLAPDGNSATLRGIELAMLGAHGSSGAWRVSICDAQYIRTAKGWQVAAMRFSPRLLADYDAGWAAEPPPLPGPSAAFPPDRPLADGSSYPRHRSPGVGFPHPVREVRPAMAARNSDPQSAQSALAVAKAYDGAENVAMAYGYFLDEAHWDEAADLFATDGWKELSYIGTYVGRERIRESLVSRYGRRRRTPSFLAIHQKTQPYVTVAPDGSRAQIRLKMFQVNSAADAEGSIILGIYEEQAKREDGVWRIHGMDLEYIVLAGYRGGWAKVPPELRTRFAPKAEEIARFSPDGPLRGLAFAPFPEIGPLGFHFANPVSGREPAWRFTWSDGYFEG